MILLEHEKHGRKHALTEAEAAADEKAGWRRVKDAAQAAAASAPVSTLRLPQKAKDGNRA